MHAWVMAGIADSEVFIPLASEGQAGNQGEDRLFPNQASVGTCRCPRWVADLVTVTRELCMYT